ncbi:unnamed protein product, partial [Brenthis ino]
MPYYSHLNDGSCVRAGIPSSTTVHTEFIRRHSDLRENAPATVCGARERVPADSAQVCAISAVRTLVPVQCAQSKAVR